MKHLNKTGSFDGQRLGQLVAWPWELLVERKHFLYDDGGQAVEAAWEREQAGKYYDSGEGGLEVWAIWPDVWTRRGCCAEGTLHHFAGSCVASKEAIGWERHGGYPCLTAILLGSIGVSFTLVGRHPSQDDETTYWCASVETLTEVGRRIVQDLSAVYGLEPKIVTYLDT